MNEQKEAKQNKVLINKAFELFKSSLLISVYLIIGVIPGVAVSWITTVVCRFFTSKPTSIELLITSIACFIAQIAFIFILLYRIGYDQKDKTHEQWKKILLYSGIIHLILSAIFGFSVLVAGSSTVYLAEYIYLLIYPQTELPIILADLPFYLSALTFIFIEAIYILSAYFSIYVGKKKREVYLKVN